MKQTDKKGFEWFRTLTKKQQKKFRKNVLKQNRNFNYRMNGVWTLESFMSGAFVWKDSKEGFNYWQRIANLKN